GRRVVLVVGLQVGVLVPGGHVGQHVGVTSPFHDTLDRLGVGIDQQLGRIEAMSVGGLIASVDAKAVALAGGYPGQVAVPVLCPAPRHHDPGLVALVAEQAQLHALRVLGEQREVGPIAVPPGSQRERLAPPHLTQRIRAPDLYASWTNPPPSWASASVASSTIVP